MRRADRAAGTAVAVRSAGRRHASQFTEVKRASPGAHRLDPPRQWIRPEAKAAAPTELWERLTIQRTISPPLPVRNAHARRSASPSHHHTGRRHLLRAILRSAPLLLLGAWLALLPTQSASAMPEFARRYNLSCAACHSAFPRLNKFGELFIKNNMRLPNWMETADQLGDDRLALPDHVPLAIRAQAYVQARQGKAIDPVSGARQSATTDFQSPYLLKLLSSAPLSKDISYYFSTRSWPRRAATAGSWWRMPGFAMPTSSAAAAA